MTTPSQYNRIRAKLERAAKLTQEASELAAATHALYGVRVLTARAADDCADALRDWDMMEDRAAAFKS